MATVFRSRGSSIASMRASIPSRTPPKNRSTFLNLTTRHRLNGGLALSGNAYYRDIHTDALNGDINEDSLDQAIYQPSAAEQAALAAAGFSGFPTSGADASNTPFPSWRCLGNVLLNDEPAEKCNGLINRTETSQQNGGAFAQLTLRERRRARPKPVHGRCRLRSQPRRLSCNPRSSGYLNPDRSVTGVNAFGDGETGGEIDGEPYDTRVDLDGSDPDVQHLRDRHHHDRRCLEHHRVGTLQPHDDSQSRRSSNPAVDPDRSTAITGSADSIRRPASPSVRRATLNIYGGYSEGSRAATSIELGCANPEEPCKLPNAMAGDPPLDQVVTRTWEAGAARRASRRHLERGSSSARTIATTSSSSCPTRPASATSGISARRGARGSSSSASRQLGRVDRRRRLHVPRCNLRERGNRQRREQQLERSRPKTERPASKARSRSTPAIASRSFPNISSRRTRTMQLSSNAVPGRRSRGGVRARTRVGTKTIDTRPTALTTSGPAPLLDTRS